MFRALVDLGLCDGLPLVHSNEPRSAFSPAAQVQNEALFVVAESGQDCL